MLTLHTLCGGQPFVYGCAFKRKKCTSDIVQHLIKSEILSHARLDLPACHYSWANHMHRRYT